MSNSDDDNFDDIDGVLADVLSSEHVEKVPVLRPASPIRTKKETSAPPTVGKEQKTQRKISTFFKTAKEEPLIYTLDKLLEEKEQEKTSHESPTPQKPCRSKSDPWKSSSKKRSSGVFPSENDEDDDVPSFEPSKKKKKTMGRDADDSSVLEDDLFAPINRFTELLKSQRVHEETKMIRENFFKNRISLPDIMQTSPGGKTLDEWEIIIMSGLLKHTLVAMEADTQREEALVWLFKVAGSHTNKKLVYILTEQLQHMYIPNTGKLVLEMLYAHGGDVPGYQDVTRGEGPTLSESQKARKSLPERDHNLAAIFQLACSETTFPMDEIPEDVIEPLFQCLISISIDSYYKFQGNDSKSLDASRAASYVRVLLNKIVVCASTKDVSLVDALLDERNEMVEVHNKTLKRIEAVPVLSRKSRLLRLKASWAALSSLVGLSSVDSDGYSIETLTNAVIPAVKSTSKKSRTDAIIGIGVPSILNDLCLGDNIVIDKNMKPVQDFIDAIELNMKGSLVSPSLKEDTLLFTDFLKSIIKENN